MKTLGLILSNILFFCVLCIGQHNFGIQVGSSHYGGDLANDPFDLQETKLGGNLYYGYYFLPQAEAKVRFSYGKISGKDEHKSTSKHRNLSFESPVYELSFLVNYDINDIELYDFTPYAYGGFGFFKFNPMAEYNGSLVELQPLGTEGQGIKGYAEKYRLTQFTIPFGGGLKFFPSKRIMLNMDLGAKKTFTDYLDDVSGWEYAPPSLLIQNGSLAVDLAYRADEIGGRPFTDFEQDNVRLNDPRNMSTKRDWYYLFSVGASYYLPKNRSLIPINRRRVPN